MNNNFIHEYLKLRENMTHYQCIKAIQMVSLLVGVFAFFVNKESLLIAILAYFWLELGLIKHQPLNDVQELIESHINHNADLLKQKAALS